MKCICLGRMFIAIALFSSACLSGCAVPSGKIEKLGDGSYVLRQEDHAGIFGNMGSLRASVNKEISAFAKKENKELVPISDREHPVGVAGDWAWYEVRFKLRDEKAEKKVTASCDFSKNPKLSILAGKIALGGSSEQTFSHLTNNTKPTDAEKAAIALLSDEGRRCQNEIDKLSDDMPLPIKAVNHSSVTAVQNLLVALYEGKITYGDFAKLRKEVADNRESAVAQISHELQKNAAEADARAQQIAAQNAIAQAQASQAFSSSMMAGAAMANAFKPTVVAPAYTPSRSTYGSSVHCTTTPIGDSLHTNCQ